MHYRQEVHINVNKVLASLRDINEFLSETLQVTEIVISFDSSLSHLILDLVKWLRIGTLIILQETQDTLNFRRLQLFVDAVQILHLILPEVQLSQWSRVSTLFQGHLWLQLQNILDLLHPSHDAGLKDMGFILIRGGIIRIHLVGGQWQQGASLR